MRKILITGMAIALVGCGGSKEYDAAAAEVKSLNSALTVGLKQDEYRNRLIDLKSAIDKVPEAKRSPLEDIYGYYRGALDIWDCRQDCSATIEEVDRNLDGVNFEEDIPSGEAIDTLWLAADVLTKRL